MPSGTRSDVPPRGRRSRRSLALPAACAIELIHTYSLIHDDLPAMDNDTLRRGRPTLHVVYGDGIAILAGDGLQAEAFALLAREPAGARSGDRARGSCACSRSSPRPPAPAGMVGGQAIDLQAAGQAPGHALTLDADGLRAMHARKTGALIRASAVSGAIMAGAADDRVDGRSTATPPRSAWRFRSSTTSSTSKATRRRWQDRRQGRRRRQADLSGALRPRAVARAGGRVRRARARRLDEAGLTDGWLGADRGWVVSRGS